MLVVSFDLIKLEHRNNMLFDRVAKQIPKGKHPARFCFRAHQIFVIFGKTIKQQLFQNHSVLLKQRLFVNNSTQPWFIFGIEIHPSFNVRASINCFRSTISFVFLLLSKRDVTR